MSRVGYDTCTMIMVHACTMIIVRARTMILVYACTKMIVHACTMIIVHALIKGLACTMIIIYACTMIFVNVSSPTGLMLHAIHSVGSRGRSPLVEQVILGGRQAPQAGEPTHSSTFVLKF